MIPRTISILGTALLTLFLAPTLGRSQNPSAPEVVAIDHLILGVSDLDDGVSQFQRLTGVRPVIGGKHPGRGTQNALVSLGSHEYLEIIAPVPGAELADEFAALPSMKDLTPIGWAVSSSDIARTAQRLNHGGYETSAPQAGSRVRPDGTRLEWKSLDISKPSMKVPPFFIQWGKSSLHPSMTSPDGCTLSSLQLAESPSEPLRNLVLKLGLDVRVSEGGESVMSLKLRCPSGSVMFPQAPSR